jgi:hypothetical protein
VSTKTSSPSLTRAASPEGCRIINRPGRVWVFGGQFSNNQEDPPSSLRESFWRQTFALQPSPTRPWLAELCRPEDFPDWWMFSGYKDLLAFERDACHLAQATILFAESPGSLAELGAIASEDSLVRHTLVVVEEKYQQERSFLRLGPLKRVEALGGLCTVGDGQANVLAEQDFLSIIEHLEKWFPNIPKTQVFNPGSHAHQTLLLADLVDVLLVSKQDELHQAATHFGVKLDLDRMKEILGLLDFFGLIKIVARGGEIFYVRRTGSSAPWVNYSGAGSSFDRLRFKAERSEFVDQNARLRYVLGGVV